MAEHGHHPIDDKSGRTDEYGNPVVNPDLIPGAELGGPLGPILGQPTTDDEPHHRRSGSSSSSSSEDDGEGGRRKKGIKDKVKEKLPGGHKDNQPQHEAGYGGAQPEPEKKGLIDKIKEKLPGGHNN